MENLLLIVLIICLYFLFWWFVVTQGKKDKERYLNQPPELWRVHQWHLIDKIKVFNFLKESLEEIKKKDAKRSKNEINK